MFRVKGNEYHFCEVVPIFSAELFFCEYLRYREPFIHSLILTIVGEGKKMVEISKCSKILYDLRDMALDHSFLEYCETGGIRLFLYREISTIFLSFRGHP